MNRTDYLRPVAPRPISARQAQVWELIAMGLPTKDIVRQLGIADGSVRAHTRALYLKIGARNRAQAAALWHRRAA